jgi:hypothetical protein
LTPPAHHSNIAGLLFIYFILSSICVAGRGISGIYEHGGQFWKFYFPQKIIVGPKTRYMCQIVFRLLEKVTAFSYTASMNFFLCKALQLKLLPLPLLKLYCVRKDCETLVSGLI